MVVKLNYSFQHPIFTFTFEEGEGGIVDAFFHFYPLSFNQLFVQSLPQLSGKKEECRYVLSAAWHFNFTTEIPTERINRSLVTTIRRDFLKPIETIVTDEIVSTLPSKVETEISNFFEGKRELSYRNNRYFNRLVPREVVSSTSKVSLQTHIRHEVWERFCPPRLLGEVRVSFYIYWSHPYRGEKEMVMDADRAHRIFSVLGQKLDDYLSSLSPKLQKEVMKLGEMVMELVGDGKEPINLSLSKENFYHSQDLFVVSSCLNDAFIPFTYCFYVPMSLSTAQSIVRNVEKVKHQLPKVMEVIKRTLTKHTSTVRDNGSWEIFVSTIETVKFAFNGHMFHVKH